MALAGFGRRLTFAQARQILGLSRSALYRLVRTRRITYVQDGPSDTPGRRGSNYHFYERDLQVYLESTRREACVELSPSRPGPGRPAADVSDLMPKERRLA